MIKKIFTRWFGSKIHSLEDKTGYTAALADYLYKYGKQPTGTKTNQWLEPQAQKLLGNRSLLYKYYSSKIEAMEAATTLNNESKKTK